MFPSIWCVCICVCVLCALCCNFVFRRLGDSVSLTMVPAFVDSDGNTVPLASEVQGVDVASQRKFELELTTSSGEVVKRVVGKSVGSESKYRFSFDIDSNLEFASAPFLEFAVRTESGQNIRLQQTENIVSGFMRARTS